MSDHYRMLNQSEYKAADYNFDALDSETKTFTDVFSIKIDNTGGGNVIVKSSKGYGSKTIASGDDPYLISVPYPYLIDVEVDASASTADVEYLKPTNQDC